ncbi:MAG: hypothetical protein R2851_23985 [Caldilineaceae bacterium]
MRGRVGAYFVSTELSLAAGATRHWHIVADVSQDGRAVADLVRRLSADGAQLQDQLETDIAAGTGALVRYVVTGRRPATVGGRSGEAPTILPTSSSTSCAAASSPTTTVATSATLWTSSAAQPAHVRTFGRLVRGAACGVRHPGALRGPGPRATPT